MDRLTFLSKIIESLSWPIASILIVIVLRGPLGRLLSRLRKFKYKDLEADFAEKLEKIEAEAEQAELPPPPPVHLQKTIPGIDLGTRKSLRQLAEKSPRAAIGEAWRQLEFSIRDGLEKRGIEQPRNLHELLDVARNRDILPQQVIPLVKDLRTLRNQAVHERQFTVDVDQSLEYIDLSERVLSTLKGEPTINQDFNQAFNGLKLD